MGLCGALRKCVLGLSLLWGACSVLDADRLDPLPIQGGSSSNGGVGGVGGVGGSTPGGAGGEGGAGGAGGQASSDGGEPDDPDGGATTRCGDGLVTGTELCDTDIAKGQPGACPTECPPLSECVLRALNGTGCRAECVVLQAHCEGDDGCCPGNCMPSNDDDCSASCGDGIVQTQQGETCEPEPDGDAGDAARCPADCDDDDPCTMDVLSGSANNCNVECAHVAITALAAGDGCCPGGANMLTDADCAPVCGNGVRERGEDCDGPTGCNQDCDLGYTAEQRHCLDTFAITNQPCDLCACASCTTTKLACFEDGNATRAALCVDLQACVRESGCYDTECYCGDSPGCFAPSGPCQPEVLAAGETNNPLDLDSRKMSSNYALGRSLSLDMCLKNSCASACQ